ncbi:MAG: beta-lactamase family protein, partial [Caldilineaceae bacterium]|nr:beta-lactamase family protein [Caldilineaceae bacterium]
MRILKKQVWWYGLLRMLVLIALASQLAPAAKRTMAKSTLDVDLTGDIADAGAVAAFFNDLIPAQMREQHIVGATVAVVQGSDILFAKGYGYADLAEQKPVIADRTLFYIGSDGKLFTWTAIMQLVEQGKLDLHTDINTYLDFEMPAAFATPITLHHLMTHTAGFEEELSALMAGSAQNLLPLREFLVEFIVNPAKFLEIRNGHPKANCF